MKYLDYDGLVHFKKKLDAHFLTKKEGKVMSDEIDTSKTNIKNNTDSLTWL